MKFSIGKTKVILDPFRFFFHPIGVSSPSCNFPFEDLTDAEDSLASDTEDNVLGISNAC